MQSCADRLEYGDTVLARRTTATGREIAERDGVSVEYVAKAMWLAKVYPQAERVRLGEVVLAALAPSHFEVVAKLDPDVRRRLLRRAAAERISVRDLRQLARLQDSANGTVTVGGASDLASTRRALEVYVGWPDGDLARLIAGPNGSMIRALAQAGQALAFRLEGRPPKNCA